MSRGAGSHVESQAPPSSVNLLGTSSSEKSGAALALRCPGQHVLATWAAQEAVGDVVHAVRAAGAGRGALAFAVRAAARRKLLVDDLRVGFGFHGSLS